MILMSTDWHFGKSNGKFDQIILKGIKEQCEYAKKHNIKVFFNLGDILDNKQTLSLNTLNTISEAIGMLLETFDEIYFIVGNHDMSRKGLGAETHNLKFLKIHEKIKVIDEPEIIEIGNKEIFVLPFVDNNLIKKIDLQKADYLFGHIEVKNFLFNSFAKAEHGFETTQLKDYKRVLLGHFHGKQEKKNIRYIGNLCRFFYGENDEERGWSVLDLENDEIEFIPYEHPSLFKINLSELKSDNSEEIFNRFKKGDNLKLIIDQKIKFSELEELKSKLVLEYGINELVLDDQYYAFDLEEDEDDTIEIDGQELEIDFSSYLLEELKKSKEIGYIDEVIDYLKEKSKNYKE